MAKLFKEHKNQYTVIDNGVFKDNELSLKARGLLCTMLSLPDGWEFSEKGIEAICGKDGQSSIRSAIKELETAKYLTRKRKRDRNGKMHGCDWIVSDYRQLDNPTCEKPNCENPNLVKPNLDIVDNKINNNKINNNKIKNNINISVAQEIQSQDEPDKMCQEPDEVPIETGTDEKKNIHSIQPNLPIGKQEQSSEKENCSITVEQRKEAVVKFLSMLPLSGLPSEIQTENGKTLSAEGVAKYFIKLIENNLDLAVLNCVKLWERIVNSGDDPMTPVMGRKQRWKAICDKWAYNFNTGNKNAPQANYEAIGVMGW